MRAANISSNSVKVIRWIARIWSSLVIAFTILRVFSPDPYATEPVPAEDIFLLSLWGLAILGLIVAWRWEQWGGLFTISIMFIREICWVILKGPWIVNFLIIWGFVVPPAILFMVASRLERKMKKI